MDQQRLFLIAPDAISLAMRWEYPDGWSLTATWSTAARDGRALIRERYDRLTAEELADLVSCVVENALKGVSA